MDKNYYVGIDPGVTGAVASAFWSNDGIPELITRKRKLLTQMDLIDYLTNMAINAGGAAYVFCLIENVGAMTIGRQACFKLGHSFAEWQMACLASGIGYQTITPQKWQSIVGLPKKKREYAQRKRDLRQLAQQRWPHCRDLINADTQDAILIADACIEVFKDRGDE